MTELIIFMCKIILDIVNSAYLLIMVGLDFVVDRTAHNVGDNSFCLISNVGGNTLSSKCFTREFR